MKYNDPKHPSVIIESPTAGHFVITGHNPVPFLDPEQGYIVPPRETYVAPECPSSALIAILEERGDLLVVREESAVVEGLPDAPKNKGGRPRKETVVVLPSPPPSRGAKIPDAPRERGSEVGFNSPEFEGVKMAANVEGAE